MKGEPLDIPKGRILYTDANGATGLFINGPYMAGFCSAAEIVIEQWRNADQRYRTERSPTQKQIHNNAADLLQYKLQIMLETVTMLGIEPLVTWLTGRLEQEDM